MRRILWAGALLSLGATSTLTAQSGLLVVAHGADPVWNKRVREVVAQVRWNGPVATAFLMGSEASSAGWDPAVAQLAAAGAKEIVAVPLMISSHGGHYRQIRAMAGDRTGTAAAPGEHHHKASPPPVPVRVTGALDGAPELAEAITGRWRALSERDRHRPLMLIAHGLSTDDEAALWVRDLDAAGKGIREAGGVRVTIALLRDDAPASVRAEAIALLHRTVREMVAESGDSVAALPVLISTGEINTATIPRDLLGLPIRYSSAGLSPWPSLARWIERVALAKLQVNQ